MPAPGDDGGFTLIEVVVSLLLLAIVSTAALGLFVRSLGSADLQGQRQQAIELANQELETVRWIPPSALATGRSLTAVQAIWTAAGAAGLSSITAQSIQDVYDNSGATALVPTSSSVTLDRVSYPIRTYLDHCYLQQVTSNATCGISASGAVSNGSGAVKMIRATVWVSWAPGGLRRCGTSSGSCSYTTSTLIDPSADPTFNVN